MSLGGGILGRHVGRSVGQEGRPVRKCMVEQINVSPGKHVTSQVDEGH